eukprot:TRINITY_DN17535_c0_g1_i1.p1 TRINITY_DN17535_c0_g1~~TRINITY_DN17535_c0_g1_i1.p1  ORF type:complete len:426 (-),score=41.94 TRINITY_DN17535_c0_g1_i1:79-1356(-)
MDKDGHAHIELMDDLKFTQVNGVPARMCTMNGDGGEKFVFLRLGPVLFPKGRWMTFQELMPKDEPLLADLLQTHLLTAYIHDVTDSSTGERVGFPPLHLHHIVWQLHSPRPSKACRRKRQFLADFEPFLFPNTFGNQGDSRCVPGTPGAELDQCLSISLPPGYGVKLFRGNHTQSGPFNNMDFGLGVELNSVEVADSRAPVPEYTVEIGLRLKRDADLKEAVPTKWYQPYNRERNYNSTLQKAWNRWLASHPYKYRAATFTLPRGRSSVHFVSVQMPYDGHVVFGTKFHTHHKLFDEGWVLQGDPKHIFAEEHIHSHSIPRIILDEGMPLDAFKASLLHTVSSEEARKQGVRIVCRFVHTMLDGFDARAQLALPDSTNCSGHSFHQGQHYTTVSFNRPGGGDAPSLQHDSWESMLYFSKTSEKPC